MRTKTLLLATIMTVAANTVMAQEAANYELRVLTFEDNDFKGDANCQSSGVADWSSLIDDPQYGGTQLYGSSGMGDTYAYYYWNDKGNTNLAHELCEAWGSYCYWSGGHAISNYGSADIETYGGYDCQLTVYNPASTDLLREGMGYNGSDNFCVHFGYTDNSGWSTTVLPAIYFADGEARVIDHMYVTNICYALNCYVNGNSLTANIGENDWVKIIATGYDAGDNVTGTAELYLVNGPENIIKDWTKFDLSSLGEVLKVEFNIGGSSDNGYGFSQPAYFAYDNLAVRFPISTGINGIEGGVSTPVGYFDANGKSVNKDHKGLTIVRMSDGSVRKMIVK